MLGQWFQTLEVFPLVLTLQVRAISTGVYELTFANPMPDDTYAVVASPLSAGQVFCGVSSKTTTGFRINVSSINGDPINRPFQAVVHATNAQLPDTVTQEQIDTAIAQSDSAMQPGDNISVLINDVGFITSADGGDADLLQGSSPSSAVSNGTIVKRNDNGDIEARRFTTTAEDQNSISGAMAFRVDSSSDHRIRFCDNLGAIRAWLLSGSGADQVGSYAFLKKINSGNAGTGVTVSGSNLRYASAAGNGQGTPGGTWKSMGRSLDDGNQSGEKMTTLYLKIA